MGEQQIRITHPYGFRSGRWATVRAVVPGPTRNCYLVEFDDGVTDFWPVTDPAAGYELRMKPPVVALEDQPSSGED